MLFVVFTSCDTVIIIIIRILIACAQVGIVTHQTVLGFCEDKDECSGRVMERCDASASHRFKHIFLDAEGTIYVPRHGRSRWAFWADPSPEAALDFFELDDGVRETLLWLRNHADTICLVSRNTEDILASLLGKFQIRDFFDEIMLNGDKGRKIEHYLRKNGFRKEESLMVGDMPTLDFYPLMRVGIEALLVDRPYNSWAKGERIRGISDLPSWLRIADIVYEAEKNHSRSATLDEFTTATELTGTPYVSRPPTKRLMAIPGA